MKKDKKMVRNPDIDHLDIINRFQELHRKLLDGAITTFEKTELLEIPIMHPFIKSLLPEEMRHLRDILIEGRYISLHEKVQGGKASQSQHSEYEMLDKKYPELELQDLVNTLEMGLAAIIAATTVGGDRTFGKGTDTDTITYDLVLEVQKETFQLHHRYKGKVKPVDNAPIVQGWDKRLCEYSYSKRRKNNFRTDYLQVYQDTAPVIDEIKSITHRYDWHKVVSSDIDGSDLQRLEELTKWIFKWGGIRPKDYSQIWKVIKTALTWNDEFGAPMDSGWTKLASFATATLSKEKQQVIWDSRVSHSITKRLDRLLDDRRIVVGEMKDIGTVAGRGGTREKSALKLKWPNGYGKWKFHFGGSRLVHQMVEILNNNQRDFPRMPHPDKGDVDWDVWGVGLVLFMDGY